MARRRLPSVLPPGLPLCHGSFRCAMGAEERLPDLFHAARSNCSKIAYDLESRSEPRAGLTVWSGRWSRPGRRSAWWARTNSWTGSSAPPGRQHVGRRSAPSNSAACRAAARPVPASAADGERPARSERGTPGPAWRPAGQAAGQSPIPAGGQRDNEVLEASSDNDAAVAAYRLSVQAGNPLSERRLARMFGRTSRRWARARIADARQTSPLLDTPSPAQQAGWQPA